MERFNGRLDGLHLYDPPSTGRTGPTSSPESFNGRLDGLHLCDYAAHVQKLNEEARVSMAAWMAFTSVTSSRSWRAVHSAWKVSMVAWMAFTSVTMYQHNREGHGKIVSMAAWMAF